jgi:hypothetical protein
MSKSWDDELKKIDRQLESISDEALMPTKNVESPVARAEIKDKQAKTTTLGVVARLLLAVALGVGMVFWPYASRCGMGLAAYLGAVGVLMGAGVWTSIWTWRHRAGAAHMLSLLLILWGGVLGAQEVLPRLGYAKPTEDHPAVWGCE